MSADSAEKIENLGRFFLENPSINRDLFAEIIQEMLLVDTYLEALEKWRTWLKENPVLRDLIGKWLEKYSYRPFIGITYTPKNPPLEEEIWDNKTFKKLLAEI